MTRGQLTPAAAAMSMSQNASVIVGYAVGGALAAGPGPGLVLLSYGIGPSAGQVRAGLVAGLTTPRVSLAAGGLLCVGAVGLVCLALPGFARCRAADVSP